MAIGFYIGPWLWVRLGPEYQIVKIRAKIMVRVLYCTDHCVWLRIGLKYQMLRLGAGPWLGGYFGDIW